MKKKSLIGIIAGVVLVPIAVCAILMNYKGVGIEDNSAKRAQTDIENETVSSIDDAAIALAEYVSGTVKDILINGNTKIIATSDSGMGIGAGVEYPEKDVTVGNITISGKSSVLITQMDRQTSYNSV